MIWRADSYISGNYFQKKINDIFLEEISHAIKGHVLDIGCGDGYYTNQILNLSKCSSITAIDKSLSMIEHANEHWHDNKISYLNIDIESLSNLDTFDTIISLWCLHWTDLNASLSTIYQALKSKGNFYAVLSSASNNTFLMLIDRYRKKNPNMPYDLSWMNKYNDKHAYFARVSNLINSLNYQHVSIETRSFKVPLNDIQDFINIIDSIPFFKARINEHGIEFFNEIIKEFDSLCNELYQGQLTYQTNPIFIHGQK